MSYPPYTPAQIVALGLDYRTQNSTDPSGWKKRDLAIVLRLGYSKAGVHILRPSSRDWTPAQLVHHTATLTAYVLDPTFRSYEKMFAKGFKEAEGFEPSADLLAEREKSIIKQNASASIVEKLSEKPCKLESKRDQLGIHLRALEPAIPPKGRVGSPEAKT